MKPLYMIFFLPLVGIVACDKSEHSFNKEDKFEQLAKAFPNKRIGIWTGSSDLNKETYELALYGELAYLRRSDLGGPRWMLPIDRDQFLELWEQFQKLPHLENYKNKGDQLKSLRTHHNVFINDVAGLFPTGRFSYSIPKENLDAEYASWFSSYDKLIDEYRSELSVPSDQQ